MPDGRLAKETALNSYSSECGFFFRARRRAITTSKSIPCSAGWFAAANFQPKENCVKHWRKRIVGIGRPFRTPNEALEPQDEAVHLRCAQRHSHHRPQQDAHAARSRV